MDFLVELILIAILLLFLYEKPKFLGVFAHSTLGKIVMVLILVGIAKTRGLVGGILAAFVMVLLLHTYKEGFDSLSTKPKKKKKSQIKVAPKKKCKPGDKGCQLSSTNRVDTENFLNRSAVEATLAASKQSNDQTNN